MIDTDTYRPELGDMVEVAAAGLTLPPGTRGRISDVPTSTSVVVQVGTQKMRTRWVLRVADVRWVR